MRRARRQRGGAAVETAISMVFIIPIFMYALFLDDLLRYRLDQQEAVLSTPWDLTALDYVGSADPGNAEHNARLMFCDHESGLDSFSGGAPDCSGEDHHSSIVAHVCWLNGNAKQVTCTGPQASVGASSDSMWADYQGEHQPKSGMYECSGKEVVENYLLPKGFFAQFSNISDGQMVKENWTGTDGDISGVGSNVHSNASAGTDQTAYFLAEDKFSLVTDSWALNTDQNAAPDDKGSGELYDRMKSVYTGTPVYSAFQGIASAFIFQTYPELLTPGMAPMPSEVTDPSMSVKPFGESGEPTQSISGESGGSYFNSPWEDWEADEYKETSNERGNHYMGSKTAQGG